MTTISLGLGDDFELIEPRKWADYEAVAAVEGFDGEDHDEETLISAWQHLIDTGMAWKLQGWFGRQAAALIEQGVCHKAEAK
jgi:hypothetical protein